MRRRDFCGAAVLLLYLLCVGLVTGPSLYQLLAGSLPAPRLELVPFADIAAVLNDPASPGLGVFANIAGNAALLAPLGFLLPLFWRYFGRARRTILFGFGVNLGPGPDSLIARFLTSLSEAMMKVVQLVTYYAPIAFFGFFANLVATYGSQIATDYARALVVYYPLCFIYIFVAFPLFAWFGGGKGAVKEMFRHIAKPAITSLGTCSSVATIPTNMEEAEATGISKDVSEIVVPLGATMHMDGSCFSCILKITFLFGVFGRPFDSIGDMALMVIVAVLSSVGMSGVPGGGYIGEFIMCSVFFPDQLAIAYPIAITIGNLVDPPATMINSAGDYVVSFLVSRFVDGKDWFQKVLASRNA